MVQKAEQESFFSIVIPNRNGAGTIGKCLDAAFGAEYGNYEVVVVDDASDDESAEIIGRFPCRLMRLESHGGAGKARNVGASVGRGDVLFFVDSDCLISKDALRAANEAYLKAKDAVIGGTYTPLPHDEGFFSAFQSVFINHSETKHAPEADYIATHAMVVGAGLFKESGGFREDFLPILEDVEFSHRMKKRGFRLVMRPDIVVTHIFGFTLGKSLMNAFRKSMYWTLYSIRNKDVLSDSGTASVELKANVFFFFLSFSLVVSSAVLGKVPIVFPVPLIAALNLFMSRGFLKSLYEAKGMRFAAMGALYYLTLYPLAVGLGAASGVFLGLKGR